MKLETTNLMQEVIDIFKEKKQNYDVVESVEIVKGENGLPCLRELRQFTRTFPLIVVFDGVFDGDDKKTRVYMGDARQLLVESTEGTESSFYDFVIEDSNAEQFELAVVENLKLLKNSI